MKGGRKPNGRIGTPRRGKRSGEQRPDGALTACRRVPDAWSDQGSEVGAGRRSAPCARVGLPSRVVQRVKTADLTAREHATPRGAAAGQAGKALKTESLWADAARNRAARSRWDQTAERVRNPESGRRRRGKPPRQRSPWLISPEGTEPHGRCRWTLAAGGSCVAEPSGDATDESRVGHPICCGAPSAMEPRGGSDTVSVDFDSTSVGAIDRRDCDPFGERGHARSQRSLCDRLSRHDTAL